MNQLPVVVLAGGEASAELRARTGVAARSLVPVGGRPMVDAVVDALRRARTVSRVVLVGTAGAEPVDALVADTGTYIENLLAGAAAVAGDDLAMVITCDVPFITPDAIDDLAVRGAAMGVDFVYAVVAVEACMARYPAMRRTALRTRQGHYTGGNAVLVRPQRLAANRARIEAAYAARKRPIRLAMMLGIGPTLGVALSIALKRGLVGVPALERAASRLVGFSARALVSPFPELAADVDRASDLDGLE